MGEKMKSCAVYFYDGFWCSLMRWFRKCNWKNSTVTIKVTICVWNFDLWPLIVTLVIIIQTCKSHHSKKLKKIFQTIPISIWLVIKCQRSKRSWAHVRRVFLDSKSPSLVVWHTRKSWAISSKTLRKMTLNFAKNRLCRSQIGNILSKW